MLQFEQTVDDATTRLAGTDRTCDLLFGVGDGKENMFRGYQYSYSVLNVYDDENLEPDNSTWHPRVPDVVYWGMDWLCPGYDLALYDEITRFYGNITVENTIKYILPAIQSGDTHAAIYDLTNNFMYYSYVGLEGTDHRSAYERQFTQIDMTKLFAEPKPQL